MTVEKRGACDRCGLCMLGDDAAVWSRAYDGSPEACTVADFDARPEEWRGWPERWEQALEGCHITFWVNGRRILGKRVGDDGQWVYPALEVTSA